MPTYKKKPHFFDTAAGAAALQALQKMVADSAYATNAGYSANAALYPDNVISFVDKHMCYLRDHPATNPEHYISNLRLMTRVGNPRSAQ
jgi:hypothetical protein